MTNLVKLVKQPDGVWTTSHEGLDYEVMLDESKVIVWRTLGLHPGGAVEVTQSVKGHIEAFTLLMTGEKLTELEFTKQHTLYKVMNVRHPYFG